MNIKEVFSDLIVNAFITIIAASGNKAKELFFGKEILEKWEDEKTSLGPVIQKAINGIVESLEWKGKTRLEEVCLFLASPEVEAITRQIFSAKILDKATKNLNLIKDEFLNSFYFYIGDRNETVYELNYLFDILIESTETALNSAINKGILSAHEAKSVFRYQIIRDELETIKKNLQFLTSPKQIDFGEIQEFEEKYRQQVAQRHAYITPPHFDAAQKLSIKDLYVSPNIITTPRTKKEQRELLDANEFLSCIYRSVLLGNPGGGKSTFALKLCFDLATRYNDRIFGRRKVTPVLIVLRDYGAEKKACRCSILQFIESRANSIYQISPPEGAFEYLLLNGRVAVIFDGLDELLETNYRQEISSDIESFCSLYPSVPVLVTSREVGYEQAPLDVKKFETFRLAPFEEDQITDYVHKWFLTNTDLIAEQQKQKANAFIEESSIVPDLRSNPLMLALMCNIYRGENYIPKNRPDVYEKCAIMLFERWDKGRGLHVTLPFEAHIKPAMMYLAYWIYGDEKLQGGVTEAKLIEQTTNYLIERRFEDPDEATKAAQEFIGFCRGRAWVFTDTGTTRDGERLYQFTHRTFLEYFTASHLVRTHPTATDLFKLLQPRIAKREWDVVAQLAFQLQNKNIDGAGDELLSFLIGKPKTLKKGQNWNVLSFAARSLEFMVPSPKVIRDLTKECIEECIKWGLKFKQQKVGREYENLTKQPEELISDLLNVADENRSAIENNLEKIFSEYIHRNKKNEIILALDIALILHFYVRARARRFRLGLRYNSYHPLINDTKEFWEKVSDRFYDIFSEKINDLYPKSRELCIKLYFRDKLPLKTLADFFGTSIIFRPHRVSTFISSSFLPIAVQLLRTIVMNYTADSLNQENFLNQIREVSDVFISSKQPWTDKMSRFLRYNYTIKPQTDFMPVLIKLDARVLFGTFALLATYSETTNQIPKEILISKSPFVTPLSSLLSARFGNFEEDKIREEIERCGFSNEQKALIWRWIRKEIDLVKSRRIKNPKKDVQTNRDHY